MVGVEWGRTVFALVPVVAVLRGVVAIAAIIGECLGVGIRRPERTGASETLGKAGLQRVIVRIERSLQRVDVEEALVGADGVDARFIGGGEDRAGVVLVQTRGQGGARVFLVAVYD